MNNCKNLWKLFLENEASDFEKERKLSIQKIAKIGFIKFIKANDWRTEQDVCKWRTDALPVIPCPGCDCDFGVADETLGLCPRCIAKFDLSRFYGDVSRSLNDLEVSQKTEAVSRAFRAFMTERYFRERYRKKSTKR